MKIKRLTYDAAFLCAALMLSYLESFIPPLLPFPGFKLGLANAAIIAVMYSGAYSIYPKDIYRTDSGRKGIGRSGIGCIGIADAAAVLLLRIIISSVLFGNPSSFIYSIAGGVCAYLVMLLLYPSVMKKKVSCAGSSVLCAAAHNIGQITATSVIFAGTAVFAYLPFMLILSVPAGLLTGTASNILLSRLGRIHEKAL